MATPSANERPAFVCPFNATIKALRVVPSAAVAANGTNFAVLSLRNRGQAGAGAALPASRSWVAGNSAAFVPDAGTLSGTASDLAALAGDVLTVQRVHSGTGVLIPACVVEVDYLIR